MHLVGLRRQTMGQKANAELELMSLLKKLRRNGPDTLTCFAARISIMYNKGMKLSMLNIS